MRGWIVAVVFLVVAGCGGGSSPEETARGFWDAVTQGIRPYISKADYEMVQGEKGEVPGHAGSAVELGAARIDGDNATVPAKLRMKGKSFDVDTVLVREDGAWKVSLDGTIQAITGMATGAPSGSSPSGVMGGVMEEMMKGMMKAMTDGMKEGMTEMGEEMKKEMEKGMEEPGTKKPE